MKNLNKHLHLIYMLVFVLFCIQIVLLSEKDINYLLAGGLIVINYWLFIIAGNTHRNGERMGG